MNIQERLFLAGQYLRHHAVAQRRLGPLEHRRQADIQRTEASDQTAGTGTHQLLAGRHLGEQVALMAAAELLRVADAENPGGAGLAV